MPYPMKAEVNASDKGLTASEAEELRYTLFRTLSDLRRGLITTQEAKAVTTAITKAFLVPRKAHAVGSL
jgi:hypothetical protein